MAPRSAGNLCGGVPDDAFGKDALAGLQVGAARRALTIATIPVDRAAPDLSAAVAAVNKARPSVVMVFLPPGPGDQIHQDTEGIRLHRRRSVALDQRHSGGDQGHQRQESRGLAVPRVLRVRMTRPTCWRPEIHESDERSGQGGSAARHFSAFVVGKITVEALKRAGRNVNREAVVAALESFGELDIGNYTIAYGPNRQAGRKPQPHRTAGGRQGRRLVY